MGLLRKISQLFGRFTTHDGLIVLTYHRINNKLAKGELIVDPKEFAAQMLFLSIYRNKFQVVGIEEALSFLKGSSGPDKTKKTRILITFDDGSRDNYINALPVLMRHRFPAVVFLTTDYINTDKKRPRYAKVPWKRDYLNMDEIRDMMGKGIAFGAHTKTHPHLAQIPPDEAKKEILGSRDALRNIYGGKDIAFCYPYGDYNTAVKNIIKDSGMTCAFSVNPGINHKGQDLFEIKRIDVLGTDNFSSFKYKVTDKYENTGVSFDR